jgi:hypothetical protein
VNPALLPYAVTFTALYLGLGLLPFAPVGIGWGEALALWPGQLFAADFTVSVFLPAMALGFVWQAACWPRAAAERVAAAGAVFFGLIVLAALLQLGQVYFLPRLALSAGLLASMPGFAAGMALWWLLASLLSPRLSRPPGALWSVLVIFAVLSVLLPLDLDAPIGDLTLSGGLSSGFASYAVDIPQRIYLLIKSAILWAPVGFLYALAGQAAALPRWGVALFAAWALLGLPLLSAQPLREVLELLFALPGLWAGAWLGERSRVTTELPAGAVVERAAVAAPNRREVPLRDAGRSRVDGASEDFTPLLGSRLRGSDGFTASNGITGQAFRANHLLGIVFGLALLALTVAGLYDFPRWQVVLAVAFVVYFGALWWRPMVWLLVLPAALALFDLAPWSGRFVFDEFDLLMLVTVAALAMRAAKPPAMKPNAAAGMLIGLFFLATLISLYLGLMPLPALDANAFASYWSPFNSLRVAKGLLWGALVWWLWRRLGDAPKRMDWLAWGMLLGALGVSASALWEAWQFTGFRLDTDYRVTGPFSSMHTGGGHIEAYLAVTLPFLVWLLFTPRAIWQRALAGLVFVAVVATLIVTVSRGGILALLLALGLLAGGGLRNAIKAERLRFSTAISTLAVMLTAGAVLAWGLQGAFFQARIATTEADRQTRLSHWSDALALRDEGWTTSLFGMGLGSFPRTYLIQHVADKPGSYHYQQAAGNTFLNLNSGGTLYMAQLVDVTGRRDYSFSFATRALGGGNRLEASVCEKKLFNSRRCQWLNVNFRPDGQWQHHQLRFNSGEVGEADANSPAWLRRPVQLSFYNPTAGGMVAIDNVSLLDAEGRNLIANGDFSAGGDHWFFKAGDHLPWHIKNLWAHLLFEHGWVGLLAFNLLLATALWQMGGRAWRGDTPALVMFSALAGLLTVGVVDSLLDAPRLALLLVFLTLSGLNLTAARPAGSGKRRRRHAAPHA